MLRELVLRTLVERQVPMTIVELERALGVPRTLLRSALCAEWFEQREIDHPKHGRVTAWVPRKTLVRVDGVGGYSIPLPKVEPVPEPVVIEPREGGRYCDTTGRTLEVLEVTKTGVHGLLLGHNEESPQPYGADAATFHKIWTEEASDGEAHTPIAARDPAREDD